MRRDAHSRGGIVIITLTGDVHVPYVTRHLSSKITLVDPARILEKCELSFMHDGTTTIPIYDDKPFADVKSVWFRRPYMPEPRDINVPASYKDYAHSSVRNHIFDLYGMFQDAFWISDYFAITKAETKPRQLELAAQLGFRTPRTLSTSSEKAATKFMKKVGGDVITKSIASSLPVVDSKVMYFYASRIAAGEEIDLSGLHVGPAIFQEAVDVVKGLRVTVVRDKVFAAAVEDLHHDDYPDITDWRRAYTDGKLRFQAYDLPKSLQDKCVALTKALNLQFGAIDILLDRKGKYWFLEINPNGQWAFVEDDTGLPIGKAIAALLETGKQEQ